VGNYNIGQTPVTQESSEARATNPITGEFPDETFAALQPIALDPRADFHAIPGSLFRAGDPIEILRQLALKHPPIVVRLGAARRVVGNAVFVQPGGDGGLHVFLRLAGGVSAKGRVRVVVSGHSSRKV